MAFVPDAPGQTGASPAMQDFIALRREIEKAGNPYRLMEAAARRIKAVAEVVTSSTPDYWFDGGAFQSNKNAAQQAWWGLDWHQKHIAEQLATGKAKPTDRYPKADDAYGYMVRAVTALSAMREGDRTMARARDLLLEDIAENARNLPSVVAATLPWWAVAGGLGLVVWAIAGRVRR